jgi:hypothetical protein
MARRATPFGKLPTIDEFIDALIKQLVNIPSEAQKAKLSEVIKYKQHAHPKEAARLAAKLHQVAKKFEHFAEKME